MKIEQLSVFVENKPGHMISPIQILADAEIDLRALMLADTQRFGILRLIVSDIERATRVLGEAGLVVKVTEVLAIEVPDHPGGLSRVLQVFAGSEVNIEYMYAFPFGRGENAALIFRFDRPDDAIKILEAAGINVLASKAFFNY
jgi:hypothetical protein